MQFTKQLFQRTLLCFHSGVARSFAICGKSSYIRHTDGMAVMILAMRSNQHLQLPTLDGTVSGNHIVIPTASPTERMVSGQCPPFSVCCPHSLWCNARQSKSQFSQDVMFQSCVMAPPAAPEIINHSQHIECHTFPVDFILSFQVCKYIFKPLRKQSNQGLPLKFISMR